VVEAEGAVDVGHLEVNVTDPGGWRDRIRGRLGVGDRGTNHGELHYGHGKRQREAAEKLTFRKNT
jgi:hypothetical protein